VFTAVVAAAFLAMSLYYSRAKKGYLRRYANVMGEQYSLRDQKYNKIQRMVYVDDGGRIDDSTPALNITKGKGSDNYGRTDFEKHMVSYTADGSVATQVRDMGAFFEGMGADPVVTGKLNNVVSGFTMTADGTVTVQTGRGLDAARPATGELCPPGQEWDESSLKCKPE